VSFTATMGNTADSTENNFEKAKNNNSFINVETASPPIYGATETNSNTLQHSCEHIVRQRPTRNASMSSPINSNRVPTPSSPYAVDASGSQHRLSHTFKRMFQIVASVSIYIILVSSSGINMRAPRGEKQFATQLRNGGRSSNPRKKSQSATRTKSKGAQGSMSPKPNQLAVPDHELGGSSADDSSMDEGGDDSPDNSGDEKPIFWDDGSGGEKLQHSLIQGGGGEARKKLRPTLAYAKSLSSHNEDPFISHYRDNINDANAGYHNSDMMDNGIIPRKKRRPILARSTSLSKPPKQNEPSLTYDHHTSKDHGTYEKAGESLTVLYGDVRSQIFISLAFLIIVIFVMDSIAREVKRRYRLPLLRQFMESFFRQAPPPGDRDSNPST